HAHHRPARRADLVGDRGRRPLFRGDGRGGAVLGRAPRAGPCLMAPELVTAGTAFAVLLGLIAIRAPVAPAMLVVGAGGYYHIVGLGPLLNYLKTTPFFLFANYTLSIIPLFTLMGALAERGGLARDLFAAAN